MTTLLQHLKSFRKDTPKTGTSISLNLNESNIEIKLLNNSTSFPNSPTKPFTVTTSANRWAYAAQIILNQSSKHDVIKIKFRVIEGEIGLLSVDQNEKTLEEVSFSKEDTLKTFYVDFSEAEFDRFFIRNVSSSGLSIIEILEIKILNENLGVDKPDSFPGFQNFIISKQDLIHWTDFYGERISTDEQLQRRRWLKKQNAPFQISWQNEILLNLCPKSDMTKSLIISGYYEPFELTTFQYLSSNSKNIIDIGSNIGLFTLIAAKSNETATIYSLEPSSREFSQLNQNIANNKLENVKALNIAASNLDTNFELQIAPPELAGHNKFENSISNENLSQWKLETVPCKKIDTLFHEINDKIDLIKIDVEGHEFQVLQGLVETIYLSKPYILIEINGNLWTNPAHVSKIVQFLQNQKFKLYEIDKSLGIWTKFTGFKSELNGNILCIPESKCESLSDVNTYLLNAFNNTITPKHFLQNLNIENLNPVKVFCYPSGLAINEARISQLDSLHLKIENKNVLEVGGGIGLLSPYFLSQNCHLTFSDSREENLNIAKQRLEGLCDFQQIDLDKSESFQLNKKFDVVFCYDTLYHLENPSLAIKSLASTHAELLLLETYVDSKSIKSNLSFEAEMAQNPNQASSGLGARPSRLWVFKELKKYWDYVYVTKTQPAYPDFPEKWDQNRAGNTRSIFVASKHQLSNDNLVDYLPMTQELHDGEYLFANLNNFEECLNWLKTLNSNSRFMISINETLPFSIKSNLEILSTSAIITSLSPCLDGTTLLCGRKR